MTPWKPAITATSLRSLKRPISSLPSISRIRAEAWGSKETALGSDDIAASDGEGTGLDTAVLTALRRLPARQREVIVLRVFLDLDIDTTARQLGIARERSGLTYRGPCQPCAANWPPP